MTRFLALAAALALGGCVADQGCGTITMPPPQYQGHKVAARAVWMHSQFIDGYCRGLGVRTNERGTIGSCTGRDALGWYHVLSDDGDPRELGCQIIHEDSHLPPNPWPWDHPSAGFWPLIY